MIWSKVTVKLQGAALFIAALIFSSPAAAEDWVRADTDNFIIYSTGSPESLRSAAYRLERFDKLLRLRYRIPLDPSPNRLKIYLLENSREVQKALNGRRSTVAGFYVPSVDGSYAISHRTKGANRDSLNPETVLFHEYGHHFMFRYFPFAYPGWYREGFAEYYATAEFDEEGNWNYGKPPLHRGATLMRRQSQIPLKRLLTHKQSELQPREAYQAYTRGWLLVHMLQSDPEKTRQLDQFLIAVGEGEEPEKAAESAFGDLGKMERELRRYMNKSPVVIGSREPLSYTGRLDIVELDETQGDLAQISLMNIRNLDTKKSRQSLEKLAAENPGNAQIWFELSETEHITAHKAANDAAKRAGDDVKALNGDMNAAIHAAAKAIEIDPDFARAHAQMAELLLDQAKDAGDTATPEMFETVRSFAQTANRLNPDDANALSLFYSSYREQKGAEVPEVAHNALTRAFQLAPEVSQLRIQYALDKAYQGDFDTAISVAEFLAADPHRGKIGERTLDQIEAIRNGEKFDEDAWDKAHEDD